MQGEAHAKAPSADGFAVLGERTMRERVAPVRVGVATLLLAARLLRSSAAERSAAPPVADVVRARMCALINGCGVARAYLTLEPGRAHTC